MQLGCLPCGRLSLDGQTTCGHTLTSLRNAFNYYRLAGLPGLGWKRGSRFLFWVFSLGCGFGLGLQRGY